MVQFKYMKKQRGFIIPLSVAIIAILIIGGGLYIYNQNKSSTNNYLNVSTTTPSTNVQNLNDGRQNASTTKEGLFSVVPKSGSIPLTVQFTNTIPSTGDTSIDYGDGTSCSTANPDGSRTCSLYTHTYSKEGTYTAILYRHFPTQELARAVVSVTDKVSTDGMKKYKDSNFGFSFWYPNNWTVSEIQVVNSTGNEFLTLSTDNGYYEDGTILKIVKVANPNLPNNGVTIEEFSSPTLSITEFGQIRSASPVGVDQKYYFDTSSHAWMYENLSTFPNGTHVPGTITVADVSHNTMGGLHIFPGAKRFATNSIVPLSASHFLIISANSPAGDIRQNYLVNTIIATDPSVATPLSTAVQTQTIQAERAAYLGQ